MTDVTTLDIILIRDGTNLIMQTSNPNIRVRLANVDTKTVDQNVNVDITPLLQGNPSEGEAEAFVDTVQGQVQNFIESGAFDRELENLRLRNMLAEATAKQAA
jgi:hypothetical protein